MIMDQKLKLEKWAKPLQMVVHPLIQSRLTLSYCQFNTKSD